MRKLLGPEKRKPWTMWAIWNRTYKRWMPVGLTHAPYLFQTRRKARAMCSFDCEMVVKVLVSPK